MDFSNWSKPNEGWDGGSIEVDELIQNAKLVASNSVPPLLIALAVFWSLKFLASFGLGALELLARVVPSTMELVATLASVTAGLGGIAAAIAGILGYSLYRPMQLQAFEGKAFVGGAGEALKLAKEAMGKTVVTSLLYGVTLFLGLLACAIGVLIPLFFFVQAPYLAATTELSPMECLRRSYELNKAYAMPVGLAIALSLVSVGAFTGCGTAIAGMLGGLLGRLFAPLGVWVAALGADLFAFAGGFAVLVITGAVFTTIQSHERGIAFRRD